MEIYKDFPYNNFQIKEIAVRKIADVLWMSVSLERSKLNERPGAHSDNCGKGNLRLSTTNR